MNSLATPNTESEFSQNGSCKKQARLKGVLWVCICIGSVIIYNGLFRELWTISLTNEYSTHILLMPLMSAALIYRKRSVIQEDARKGFSWFGILPMSLGLAMASAVGGMANMSFRTAGIVILWMGAFVFVFGLKNFRRLLFPVVSLGFVVPLPTLPLQALISLLRRGSAEGVSFLFKVTGTPFYREGIAFVLPGIRIEIAEQCSSIRSSLALFISSMLAAHLVLRTNWRKLILVLAAVPMAMLKNAIRIWVLSLLAIHVDKKWLTASDLHRDGGILFFILALLLLFPILWLLKRSEKSHKLTGIK
jgi:exosortase